MLLSGAVNVIPRSRPVVQTILIFSIAGLVVSPGSEAMVSKSGAVCPGPETLLLLVSASHPQRGDLSFHLPLDDVLIYGLGSDRYKVATLPFTEVFCIGPVFSFVAPKEAVLVASLVGPLLRAELLVLRRAVCHTLTVTTASVICTSFSYSTTDCVLHPAISNPCLLKHSHFFEVSVH